MKGFSIGHAGNRVGWKTVSRLGINENMRRFKRNTDEMIREAARDVIILRNAYGDFRKKYPLEVRNTMERFLKIKSAIFAKEKQPEELRNIHKELMESWEKNRNVKAVVRGSLPEGVLIEIDGMKSK